MSVKFLNSNTALGGRVAVGVSSLVGPTGSIGLQGPPGGGTGGSGFQGPQGLQGLIGATGFQGIVGPQGIVGSNGISGGLTLFLDTVGGTYSGTPIGGSLITFPNQTTGTIISSGNQTNTTINIARFISATGALQTNVILGGLWDMNLYASSANSYYWFSVAYVDGDGISNRVNIATGGSVDSTVISTDISPYLNSIYVPTTTLPDTSKRILIDVFLQTIGTTSTDLYFRNSTLSHVHTTLLATQTATGPQGVIGPQGLRGSTGSQGFQGLVGVTGAQGFVGATGSIGLQGPAGAGGSGTGSSQWISSTGGIIYYSSGSIGINKANPTGALDIVGAVSITGPLNLTGNMNMIGNKNMTGGLNIAGNMVYTTTGSLVNPTFQNYKETVNLGISSSASYVINCNTGNNFNVTLATATTAFSFINIAATGTLANINLFLTQDNSGGRLATWPASVSWGNPSTPVLSTTGNATDIISLTTFSGGSKWFGFLAGRGF